jgi:hypothetical protein
MRRQRVSYCCLNGHGPGGCKHRHLSLRSAIRCAKTFKKPMLVAKNWSDTFRGHIWRYRIIRWVGFTKAMPHY